MPGASPTTERIEAVARVAAMAAEAGEVVVADALAQWCQDGIELHVALGLAPDWHAALRRRRRDALLVEIARRHFADLGTKAAAASIAGAVGRYAASAWQRDRKARRRPSGLEGDVFDLLGLGEPLGPERVRQILRAAGGNHGGCDYPPTTPTLRGERR
ncbi:MAG: hypothetical protein KGL52_14055 [Rhodospirillales bacterium]|nr:hypothetical protein [Rhodospirillales bacterium]